MGFLKKFRAGWFAFFSVLLISLSIWGSFQIGYLSLRQSSLDELFRYRNYITGLLDRYAPLPEVISAHPALYNALIDNDLNIQEEHAVKASKYLRRMNRVTDASAIYLMDKDGRTQASSNYGQKKSFVGRNFSFRPYFRQAINGNNGRYFALGTTSKERGYYFSSPVRDGQDILGVLVVKLSLYDIENEWRSPWGRDRAEMVVSDQQGVVFISTRKDWLFHSMGDLSAEERVQLLQERRYDNRLLSPLSFQELPQPFSLKGTNSRLISLGIDKQQTKQYLDQSMEMPEAGWKVHVLSRTSALSFQVFKVAVITVGLILIGTLIFLYLRERVTNETRLKRLNEELDQKVQDRTVDLTISNEQLKSAQNELIQTAKMALLGQMSAGINHELNQPLTAIRSYASNALVYLEKARIDRVRENLESVKSLANHMTDIVGQLKVFARKTDEVMVPVALEKALNAATGIVSPQIKKYGINLTLVRVDEPVQILGNLIRIEQVFVNLLSNAIQAVKYLETPKISIEIQRLEQNVKIIVADNGAGIDPAIKNSLFEPFVTTRDVDQGLGLGLSISHQIIQSMNGSITVQEPDESSLGHGAVFCLELAIIKPEGVDV